MGEWYQIYVKKELYGNAGSLTQAKGEKENILRKFKVKSSDIKIVKK